MSGSDTKSILGMDQTTFIIVICSAVGGLIVLLAIGCCVWRKSKAGKLCTRRTADVKPEQVRDVGTSSVSGEDKDADYSVADSEQSQSWRGGSFTNADLESRSPTFASEWQLSAMGDDGISTYAGDTTLGGTFAPLRMRVAFQPEKVNDDDRIVPGDETVGSVEVDFGWKPPGEEPGTDRAEKIRSDMERGDGLVLKEHTPTNEGDTRAKGSNTPPPQYQQTKEPYQSSRQEIIDVIVPPGKLGIVVDTPKRGGPPAVHAVLESSMLSGMVEVGDRLVAVDDRDVSSMTAAKVSKMISLKNGNPSRKLTLSRAA